MDARLIAGLLRDRASTEDLIQQVLRGIRWSTVDGFVGGLEKPMRILTLGYQSSGKTTYMASLYGQLQSSFHGLSLAAKQGEDDRQLTALAREIGRGRYPPMTARRSDYHFQLRLDGQALVEFHWSDYAGGLLKTFSADNPDVPRMREELKKVDGVMLICDAEVLARRAYRTSEFGLWVTMLTEVLRHVSRPLSVALVLTKFDLIRTIDGATFDGVGRLVQSVSRNDKVSLAVIPVQCGGSGFVNVPLPLFFALVSAMDAQRGEVASEVALHRNRAAYHDARKGGFWGDVDKLWSRIVGEQSHEELARQEHRQLATKSTRQARLDQATAAMRASLKHVPPAAHVTDAHELARHVNAAYAAGNPSAGRFR